MSQASARWTVMAHALLFVSGFTIVFVVVIGGLGWLGWLRRPIPWWAFVLLLLPMAADGLTHMLGLRDSMMDMMDSSFGSFYVGAQVWSLNWWLRVITGLAAALGAVWFAYPRMDRAIEESDALRLMYRQAEIRNQKSDVRGQMSNNAN